jgi:hypothetical protein
MAFVNKGKAPVHKGHTVISTLHLLGLPRIIEKIPNKEQKNDNESNYPGTRC